MLTQVTSDRFLSFVIKGNLNYHKVSLQLSKFFYIFIIFGLKCESFLWKESWAEKKKGEKIKKWVESNRKRQRKEEESWKAHQEM